MSEAMTDERLNFVRLLTDPDFSLSVPDHAKAAIRDLLVEVERLRAWKAEAMAVHAEWEATWHAAGRPGRLGGSKAVGVREEVARLRAALERVTGAAVTEFGRVWDEGNAVGLDGWIGPNRGAGEVDDEAIRYRSRDTERAEASLFRAVAAGEQEAGR